MLVTTQESDLDIQVRLIAEAEALLEDEIYIRAQPLLEQAISYDAPQREKAEQLLKGVYKALIEETGYANLLDELIETQISREDCPAYLYQEASDHYLGTADIQEAIAALRIGYARTGDEDLGRAYESIRYAYTSNGELYDEVTAVYNGMIQVKRMGSWGMADSVGTLVIPCQYDKISTYSADKAIVRKDGEIFSIDSSNHRLYLLKEPVEDFSNYGNDLVGFLVDTGWVRGNGTFAMGTAAFEELGMYTNGYAAAKQEGKWGVINTDAEWVVQPIYDEILMDELGRCWEQNAVFARSGSTVHLIIGGEVTEYSFEDAHPFNEEGWAAVKKAGKWCFIDASGQVMLECDCENVRSFGGHLAAVQQDGLWGFISTQGQLVVDYMYTDVRDFTGGSAPVCTEDGWMFIILDEYKED